MALKPVYLGFYDLKLKSSAPYVTTVKSQGCYCEVAQETYGRSGGKPFYGFKQLISP